MNQIGIENLCNGIVLQAVQDYRTALNKHDEEGAKSIERFFRSPWYEHLTNVDGEYLIEKIRNDTRKIKKCLKGIDKQSVSCYTSSKITPHKGREERRTL